MWIKNFLMLAIVLSIAPPRAHAQDRGVKDLPTREREAKLACLTGDATTGARMLAELYIDTQVATYLFNQGRCYEQNSRFEDAIAMFREYLRKGIGIAASDRRDTEQHIADCEALLGKSSRSGAVPLPLPPASPQPPRDPSAPAVVAANPVVGQGASEGSGLRVAGIIATSVGLSAVIAGAVLNLAYNQTIDDLRTSYRASKESDNQTKKTLAVVGYGSGTVCLVGGLVLYYLGWKAGQSGTTIQPATVDGKAGLAVRGTF